MKFLLPVTFAALLVGCGTDTSDTSEPPDQENDNFVIEQNAKDDAQGIQEASYDALCVLNFVNQASEEEIFDNAHTLPAENIWRAKVGTDGVIGTADDHFFETVEELDDVSFVGFFTFRSLKKFAAENNFCPTFGQETVLPGEETLAVAVGERSAQAVREEFQKNTIARRDAHAKAHGCVKATMTIDNSELTNEERVGIFADNTEFPAWIRFSNGNPVVQNDEEKDARGFAVKLMEVPGTKVLDRHRDDKTQDFLMINGPAFFVRTPSDYLEFTNKAFDGSPISYFLSLNPLEWKLRELTNTLRIALAKPSSPITQYWSTTPYALGGAAVKYSARPCGEFGKGFPDDPTADFLGETLAEELENDAQCFDFLMQRQIDAASMPIEDSTIEWEIGDSPYFKVGEINIPAQTFLSDSQKDFCENLSFNPWHTLPEHKPLGNINRTRRIVYDMISDLRHELNMEPRAEPTGHIDFE